MENHTTASLTVVEASPNADLEDAIVRSWESRGMVKEAPRFAEQILDETRRTTFQASLPNEPSYKHGTPRMEPERITEIDGIREVHDMLTDFISYKTELTRSFQAAKQPESKWVSMARDVLENITFIGEKEFQEAAWGIGLAWKAYLKANPDHKLCVWTGINEVEGTEDRKSDNYLMNEILETFTDEELDEYSGRIVTNLEDMDADTERGKIVLLDDWIISGKQMRGVYNHLLENSTLFQAFAEAGQVEINLITASEDRIQNGLHLVPGKPEEGTVPVRAYYQAHHAPTAHDAHNGYITGLHSPGNYGFSEVCRRVAKKYPTGIPGEHHDVPKIVRIVPDYRNDVSSVEITGNNLRRLTAQELARARAIKQAGTISMVEAVE